MPITLSFPKKTTLELSDLLRLKAWVVKKNLSGKLSTMPLSGASASPFKGRGMEFEESRHYFAGDEIRHMDWRVTARTGKPYTKTFVEEHERAVYFYIHFSQSLYFGSRCTFKSVAAICLTALAAWQHFMASDALGGVWNQGGQLYFFPAKYSQTNLIHLFNQWLSIQKERAENLLDWQVLAKQLPLFLPHGSQVMIVSDFYQPWEIERLLSNLARRHLISLVQVYDELEQAMPGEGIYPVTDNEKMILFNSQNMSLRQQYSDLFQAREQQLIGLAKKYQANFISCSTAKGVMFNGNTAFQPA